MNSNQTSTSSPVSADAVSRRAYELWEQEGRPEGGDLRHWLQAEKELGSNSSSDSAQPFGQSDFSTTRSVDAAKNTDTRPLQGTRAGAAAKKNGMSTAPFERSAPSGGQGSSAKRR